MKPILLFEDEASFGRISEPSYCWIFGDDRQVVPAIRVREYRYSFGCVEPKSGDFQYEIHQKCNTENFNKYIANISSSRTDCLFMMITDGAKLSFAQYRHKSKTLVLPENMRIILIPPRTPEMNPTEQCWREIRTAGFKNKIFGKISAVIDKFEETVSNISKSVFQSITSRSWIPSFS